MKTEHIMEALVGAIEDKGFTLGWSSEHINFEIDGKEYVLRIYEVLDGEHWSEKGEQHNED